MGERPSAHGLARPNRSQANPICPAMERQIDRWRTGAQARFLDVADVLTGIGSIRRRYRTTYGSRTTTVAEAAARGQRPAGGGVVGNGRIIRILLGLIGAREYGVHLREIIISVIVAVISDGIVKTRDGSARGCGVSTSQAAATRSWFHIAANGARNARDGKSGEHSASRPQTRGGGGGESGSFGLARQARGEVNLRRAPRVRTYEPSSWSPR